jgi:DNA mismatch endonuclease (patch repair protein)
LFVQIRALALGPNIAVQASSQVQLWHAIVRDIARRTRRSAGIMADKVTQTIRSQMMSAVRGKDTRPERAVRSALFAAGYRYRLHRRDLPGAPDIVLPRFRTAVFVHGCFWHGHDCPRGRRPTSNIEFWNRKLDSNVARDRQNHAALRTAGWRVEVIWQCSLAVGCERLLVQLDTLRKAFFSRRTSELTK